MAEATRVQAARTRTLECGDFEAVELPGAPDGYALAIESAIYGTAKKSANVTAKLRALAEAPCAK